MTNLYKVEAIGILVSEELKVNPSLGDDLPKTMGRITTILIQNGYSVRFIVTEDFRKNNFLQTNVLELKHGNNGGFKYSVSDNGVGEILLLVSIRGIQTSVTVPMEDVVTIIVYDEQEAIIPLASVLTSVTWGRFNTLFTKREVPVTEKVPKEKNSKVVSISDYRK